MLIASVASHLPRESKLTHSFLTSHHLLYLSSWIIDSLLLCSLSTQHHHYDALDTQSHLLKMAEVASGGDNFLPTDIHNRPDEFKIEQGLHAAQLPFLDQTGDVTVEIQPRAQPELSKDEEAIRAVGNRDELFQRERDGWEG